MVRLVTLERKWKSVPEVWCTYVISALGRMRQENHEFKASLSQEKKRKWKAKIKGSLKNKTKNKRDRSKSKIMLGF
jgi:hypothetical protein